jgi:hypothetical protein
MPEYVVVAVIVLSWSGSASLDTGTRAGSIG